MLWLETVLVMSAVASVVLGATVLWFEPRSALNRLVALTALSFALWAFGSSVGVPEAVGPLTTGSQWLVFRWALVGDILTQLFGLGVALTFARVSGVRLWVTVVLFSVAAVVHVVQALTGSWVVSGLRLGPNGPTIDLNLSSPWPLLYGVYVYAACLVSIGSLVAAYRRQTSRSFRSLVAQLVTLGLGLNVAELVASQLWLRYDWPDLSIPLAFLALLNVFVMLVRRQDYLRRRPRLTTDLLSLLDHALLLADARGRVVQISAGLARLWGRSPQEVQGGRVFDLLDGWPGLERQWRSLVDEGSTPAPLVGNLAGELFWLHLSPNIDRFGDLAGASIQLRPVANFARGERFGISQREHEVARLIMEGLENQDIADTLGISRATVKNHVASLFEKTGVQNRLELVSVLRA